MRTNSYVSRQRPAWMDGTFAVALALSASAAEVAVKPTFHCMGLYWAPPGGAPAREVRVQYRRADEAQWREGLPLRYRPVDHSLWPELPYKPAVAPYRGSLVNLEPATTYAIKLSLQGTPATCSLTASTWSEAFPIGSTVRVPSGGSPYAVTQSGTPDAYRLYDGRDATIDAGNTAANNITIDASYVILRGFTLRGATQSAIEIKRGHDIIIEECDISHWGTPGWPTKQQVAIWSLNLDIERIVVQRCKIHEPRAGSHSWVDGHPGGPEAIGFAIYQRRCNFVVRYNEIRSSPNHYYNDAIGYGAGWSDSDIYGNYIAQAYDDGIEAEGFGVNLRVWHNYIEDCQMAIANAAVRMGPLYVWRNVSGYCDYPTGGQSPGPYGCFIKMGYGGSTTNMQGDQYIFHNTIFRNQTDSGFGGLGTAERENRIIRHVTTRNNILHVRSTCPNSISTHGGSLDNDFDYDLYNKDVPPAHEQHGIRAVPRYAAGAAFNTSTKTGNFQLAPGSPGYDSALLVPNFTGPFTGGAPDIGAHEAGAPAMVFGVEAGVRLSEHTPPAAPTGLVLQ
ncbi:MAG: right-handed parallel beta-helix repeat-containing protein [Kiritimatiellae bacterium]|nr:right-handed parallel beta-helix repeat-containing protein [Kiritimatiellia bacterium]